MTENFDNLFLSAFRGRFHGVLRWEQLDTLWEKIRIDSGSHWYIYAVGQTPPSSPSDGPQLKKFIAEIDQLIRKEHDEDYCGIVYTDSFDAPAFVKIFDPNNLGVTCGYSDNPPLPGWILSKLCPVDLPSAMPVPANRRRWWQRLFGT